MYNLEKKNEKNIFSSGVWCVYFLFYIKFYEWKIVFLLLLSDSQNTENSDVDVI